jgi:hypothetical protein
VLTIGAQGKGEISGFPASMARGRDGTIYLVDERRRLVQVYTGDGRFVREIGRTGQGPGEYQDARVLLGSDQRIHVLDPRSARHTTLSPDGTFIESVPLPSPFPAIGAATLLVNGHLVTNMFYRDRAGGRFALQEVDAAGKQVKLLDEGSYTDHNDPGVARLLFARPNGDLWSIHTHSYAIDRFAADLTTRKSLVRVADWFKPVTSEAQLSGGEFDQPPSTIVHGLWEDAGGLLWTMTPVAAKDWKAGPTFAEWRAAGMPSLGPPGEKLDTMIEVLDPAAGRLVAFLRVDQYVVRSLGDGYVASYREDADGTPLVDIWLAQLRRP